MKNKILLILIVSACSTLNSMAQSNSHLKPEYEFDFWLGDWTLLWKEKNPNGKDSINKEGRNHVTKILDNKVIQENFIDSASGFKGTSISVYDTTNKVWHQAWADNQGGFYSLIGEIGEDKKIFRTEPELIKGKIVIKRMIFYNIQFESFKWQWEMSDDNEITWKPLWKIQYYRIK